MDSGYCSCIFQCLSQLLSFHKNSRGFQMFLNSQLSDLVVNKITSAPCSSSVKYLQINICVIWPPQLIKQRGPSEINCGSCCQTITWNISFQTLKKRSFAFGENDGSQPAWDVCDWDHMKTWDASALELSQTQPGAGRRDSRAAFRSTWTVHSFPFHFQDEMSA